MTGPSTAPCRRALAEAVDAVYDLGGCVDLDCREANCWLGGLDDTTRSVVRDVLEEGP